MIFLVFVPVRVSRCRPSRGIHFPGEHPPGPGDQAMDCKKLKPKGVGIYSGTYNTAVQYLYAIQAQYDMYSVCTG